MWSLCMCMRVVSHRIPELLSHEWLLAVNTVAVVLISLLGVEVPLLVLYLKWIAFLIVIKGLHLVPVTCVVCVHGITRRLLVSVRVTTVLPRCWVPNICLVPFVSMDKLPLAYVAPSGGVEVSPIFSRHFD